MNVIEIQNLTKKFGDVVAIDDASFSVEKGGVFGFLGPNGAGKTTIIRCLMDFIRPDSGSVSVFGLDAQKNSVEIKNRIGYLSGEIDLYGSWTVRRHIDFFRKIHSTHDVADDLVSLFSLDLGKKAKNLSSGNKQKLGLVLAFMFEPDLVILDEPTNGLDPILQNRVYDLIRDTISRGATVLMSSHNLAEVERVCEHVAIIRSGKIIAEEKISDLKRKRLYSVRIASDASFDANALLGEGDEIVREHHYNVEYRIKSDIDVFLSKLSGQKIVDIEISHARLEDIFLEYYQT